MGLTAPIGYYAHHQGEGHRHRAHAIARHLADRLVLIGAGVGEGDAGLATLDLPDDRPCGDDSFNGRDGTSHRPGALHYAPLHHQGVRDRVAIFTAWVAKARPALLVVDVSVEIAMLARLAATPTVYVRLTGGRTDAPHLDAFRGARALIAPFDAALDDPEAPRWVRDKTLYIPGITRERAPALDVEPADILVVIGAGGSALTGAALAQAAAATPERRWRVIGSVEPAGPGPSNLAFAGWREDASEQIAAAAVVIGGAGDGLVSAVLAADRPFICLPEPRPFDEQVTKGQRLHHLGAAIVLPRWPEPADWPRLLKAAGALPPDARRRLHAPDGAARAAALIRALADEAAP